MSTIDFETFFRAGSRKEKARPYQARLCRSDWPQTLIVPTGFGKTAAVLAAWLWKTHEGDAGTPRRLVYCLPMRTLVEQTATAAEIWVKAAKDKLSLDVTVHTLMGGQSGDRTPERRGVPDWIMNPDRPAILIGTQDLLVSAALMRGYGVSRYRWPVDFALLHNDAFWVFDEVQLTGASLATSAQLEGLRRDKGLGTGRPCRTLWMSATLDPVWLKTVDFTPTDPSRPHDLSEADLAEAGRLWTAVKRLARLDSAADDTMTTLAAQVKERARPGTDTIIFLNTVKRAQALYDALGAAGIELDRRLLIHSRFRAGDRKRLMERLEQAPPPAGRIVVATQALEAGVDVTSAVMITEIAPWSSLVQRFGRCNRYGECGAGGADVFWIDLPDEDKAAKPYTRAELAHAKDRLATLDACGPADLARIPLPAPPRGHVIRRRDLFDLFDTDPDLSGFDVDVSLYVREVDDTDVRLFWRAVDKDGHPPETAAGPSRDELCPAPIGGAKALVKRAKARAWGWNPLVRAWRRLSGPDDLYPGMVVWVDAASGGYDSEKGFDPESKKPVEPVSGPDAQPEAITEDPDSRGKVRVSLARHSARARDKAAGLAEALGLPESERDLIVKAALWHDLGKVHEAFVAKIPGALAEGTPPLAKWGDRKETDTPPNGETATTDKRRKYFRHELASALGYLANQGWQESASLAAYLIAAHHGKVRMRLRALPKEQPPPEAERLFARGVYDGDTLPETVLPEMRVPATTLDLDLMRLGDGRCGSSWSARTQRLLKEYGPFRLSWLEALVRIADWRASQEEDDQGHDDL